MADNRFVPPASTLEVLETVPESVLRRLKQYSGRLATEAVHAMEERLPFFADLEASQRASVQLVVQTAVVNFVEWMRDPHSDVSYTAQAFEVVPQDLRRRIALRQSRRDGAGHDGVLRGSRAAAGPLRGAADRADGRDPAVQPRLGVRRGHRLRRPGRGARRLGQPDGGQRRRRGGARRHRPGTAVPGRGAELGRHRAGHRHRRACRSPTASTWPATTSTTWSARHGRAALSDVHGTWLVAIVSGQLSPTDRFLAELLGVFADGPVVIGPTAPTLTAAPTAPPRRSPG